MSLLGQVFDISSILIWAYATYLAFQIAKDKYGGSFTSLSPPLVGSVTVFFLMGIIEFVHYKFVITSLGSVSDAFSFGLMAVQLAGGIMLLKVVNQLYQIEFATRGFINMGDDE